MPTQGESAALALNVQGPGASGFYTVLESTTAFTGLWAGPGVALLVSGAGPVTYVGKTAALNV